MMKKLFGLMILAGIILAMATAGGFDSGVIDSGRIFVQSVISVALIYSGSVLMGRSVEA